MYSIAPKDSKPIAMYPGNHDGNTDARLIKKGATLYLPVQVGGGLLSMGEFHAVQGDGQSIYCDNDDMDFYNAGLSCGLYANLEISQVVDPFKTTRMSIDEEIINQILKKY